MHGILGKPDEQFWPAVFEQEETVPDFDDVMGVILYGDEGTVQGSSTMFLSWMSEHALKPTDAHSSRNLITIIPSEFYLTANKVNETLQEAMRVVTSNMNKFFREGTCGLRALVSTLKGDWKFMKQIMNLAHYATSNKVCWMCDATKSLENPLTNISASASWRDKIWLVDPWDTKPAIVNLERWTIKRAIPDLLHVWYLGVGRDLVGAVMVHLLASTFWPGRYRKQKLQDASRALRVWAKENKKQLPRHFRFKKDNLNLKGGEYAELKAKAAHTMVILQWLATLDLSEVAGLNENVSSCLFASDFVFKLLNTARHESLYLTEEQQEHVCVVGEFFCSCYLHLHVAGSPGQVRVLTARVRPKFHLLHHLFLLSKSQRRNVSAYACWMDEDWIKKVAAIARKVHLKSYAIHTLKRWLLGIRYKVAEVLEAQTLIGVRSCCV